MGFFYVLISARIFKMYKRFVYLVLYAIVKALFNFENYFNI